MAVATTPRGDGTVTELELIQRGAWPIPAGVECFYCGQPFKAVGVYWIGSGGDLCLHPACVFSLFTRLVRDVHEIEVRFNARAWELERAGGGGVLSVDPLDGGPS